MRLKPKRYILLPIVILIYTAIIAIYAYNKFYTPDQKGSYIFFISINVLLSIILYFILKKRDSFRKKK